MKWGLNIPPRQPGEAKCWINDKPGITSIIIYDGMTFDQRMRLLELLVEIEKEASYDESNPQIPA